MTPRRNRRAGVEDLWRKSDGTPSKLDGTGKRWRARYVDNLGKEHTRRWSRKADAQKWLDNITSEHVTGTYVDPALSKALFGVVAERWFATKATKEPKTIAGYRSLLDRLVLPRWSDVALKDITHEDVQTWVIGLSQSGFRFTDRGLSPSRVIQAYQVVDQVLRYAIKTGRLTINPADDVELPRKTEPEKRYLTHEQVAALAGECERFRVLVLTLAYCGLRFGEAVALRVKYVDVERQRIQVRSSATAVTGQGIVEGDTKNHTARAVPVPAFLLEELQATIEGRGGDDLVFPGRKGGFLPLGELRWQFDQAASAVGLAGLVPHELRHTAASLAITAGANVKVVQRMLGHKTATLTLDRYGHLFPDDLDSVAAALDAAYRLRTEPDLRVVR